MFGAPTGDCWLGNFGLLVRNAAETPPALYERDLARPGTISAAGSR